MVKFATPADPTYQTAVTHLKDCIRVCDQLRNLAELNPANVGIQTEGNKEELKERFRNLRNMGDPSTE
jgi:hypothetical protein